MSATRSILAGLALPLVLVSGCSGDDPVAASPSSAGQTASAGATADAELADGLISEGLDALAEEEPQRAARLFTSVLDLDADNVFAHYNLGYLAQLDGDVGPALQHYTAALETQPDFAPALYNLAILTEPADLSAAVDLYRRVVDSNGGDAGTFFRLGHALVELGQLEQGQDLIAQAIDLDASLADTPAPVYS